MRILNWGEVLSSLVYNPCFVCNKNHLVGWVDLSIAKVLALLENLSATPRTHIIKTRSDDSALDSSVLGRQEQADL